MTVADLIKTWFKENKLSSHYEINEFDMIECKQYHCSGINRLRVVDDTVYYWIIKRGEFHKLTLNAADPDFFAKLMAVLYEQCANRRKKVYRQL